MRKPRTSSISRTAQEAQTEVANIEGHIKAMLPADYLASIGANGAGTELHHRCLRIFSDLADRLAAPRPDAGETPTGLVDAGQRLADAAKRYADRLDSEAAVGQMSVVAEMWRLLAGDWDVCRYCGVEKKPHRDDCEWIAAVALLSGTTPATREG